MASFPDTPTPIRLFLSYDKNDAAYLEEFKRHFAQLTRQNKILLWTDENILPGEEWQSRTMSEIRRADVIILLISANYLNSDEKWNREMLQAFERHRNEQTIIVPIIITPCDWESTPFAELNIFPKKNKYVSKYQDRSEAWLEVIYFLKNKLFGDLSIIAYDDGKEEFAIIKNIYFKQHLIARYAFRLFNLFGMHNRYLTPLENKDKSINKKTLKALFYKYIPPTNYSFPDLTLLVNKQSEISMIQRKLAGENNLLSVFQNLIFADDTVNILLLSESGIGKTTFLQYLFYKQAQKNLPFNLAFIYSNQGILSSVKRIKKPNNTILFIDGLDEDKNARLNLADTLYALSSELKKFKKIIVSCRTQFFSNHNEEWKSLGGGLKLHHIYLSSFTENEAKSYLRNKFKNNKDHLEKALLTFEQSPKLFCRPLLLSWFDLLINNKNQKYSYFFEAFETIVHGWAEREAEITESDNVIYRSYPSKIQAFSKMIALNIYNDGNNLDNYINFENIESSAKSLNINKRDAQSRSFLSRNIETNTWQFSHNLFLDYFLSLLLLDGTIREEEFDFDRFPEVANFHNDMCMKQLSHLPIDQQMDLIDLSRLRSVFKTKNINIEPIKNKVINANILKLPRHTWSQVSKQDDTKTYWESYILTIKSLLPAKITEQHYIFKDYDDYCIIINEDAKIYIENRHYLKCLLYEFVFWRYISFLSRNATSDNYATGSKFISNYDYSLTFSENLPKSIRDIPLINILNFALTNTIGLANKILSLDLSQTSISEFSEFSFIAQLTELKKINLSGNNLSDIKSLRPILELPELEELNLSGNPLPDEYVKELTYEDSLKKLRNEVIFPPNMIYVEEGSLIMGKDYSKNITKILKSAKYTKEKLKEFIALEHKRFDNRPKIKAFVDSFYIGKYPVTIGEFRSFIESTGYITDSESNGGSLLWDNDNKRGKYFHKGIDWRYNAHGQLQTNDRTPVIHVSWNDAVKYCEWLFLKTGLPFRLPTEAEWEFTAKGGEHYYDHELPFAGSDNLDEVGWYFNNSGDTFEMQGPKPAGKKRPNALNIYDLCGNVHEWCSDWFGSDYFLNCSAYEIIKNPQGAVSGLEKILKGGHWRFQPNRCKVNYRGHNPPPTCHHGIGFRVCYSVLPKKEE